MDKRPVEYKKHVPQRIMKCGECLSDHGEMLEALCDYDWREAHEYAGWAREDVEKIIYAEAGENDGDAWIGLFLLKNGKYAGLNAWCDYTGWD